MLLLLSSPPYQTVIGSDSPVAWWKLNETSGTSAADSGSGIAANGTYTGTFTLGQPGIDGADSGGGTSVLTTSNSGNYIDIGALPAKLQFTVGTAFSIEAWTAIDPSLTSVGPALVTEAYAGDGTVRYMLGTYDGSNATLKPSFGWYNGAWRLIQSSTAINDDKWHHLVGTFDGTQLRLYVDGSLVAGPTTPGGIQPGGVEHLYIGRRWDSNSSWQGYIDEVAMYGVALTVAQVSAHYAAYHAPTTTRFITQELAEVAEVPTTTPRQASQVFAEIAEAPTTTPRQVSSVLAEVAYAETQLIVVRTFK